MADITFKAGSKVFPLNRTYVMGILNVTPDSFSDGGKFNSLETAVLRAIEMEHQGADIIDIGAQSTRPGFVKISADEEWERLEKILSEVRKNVTAAISVDTFYPEIAQKALNAGADIINDISGFSDEMFSAVKDSGCGCIIMYPFGEQKNILTATKKFFSDKLEQAKKFGIAADRVCFDPGIGFGKTNEENLEIIANVGQTKLNEIAYLMAASRKRVIGQAVGNVAFTDRLSGTLAAHTISVFGGADIVRVHDVAETVQAAKMADAILKHRN